MAKQSPARTATLGHAHLKVRDVDASIHFYETVLGWKVTERVANTYAFLSSGAKHHELALQNVGAEAPTPRKAAVGLYHLAFEFPDVAELRLAVERSIRLGYQPTLVDHGISWAAYLADPDGNGVEIYIDRRSEPSGAPLWLGRSLPLHLPLGRPAL